LAILKRSVSLSQWYGSSIVVEHLPHHPKVKCLSPPAATGTGRENGKIVLFEMGLM